MLHVVGGATGTGKSEFALRLAESLASRDVRAEIVNADAFQLYRGMDVATAKLRTEERRGVPHHLLDVLEVSQDASVARYQTEARAVIERLERDGVDAILVGGSGLYIEAVIHDLRFPGTDPAVRAELEARLQAEGAGALLRELVRVDPLSAARLHPGNARRIVRALEVYRITGEPFSSVMPERPGAWRPCRVAVLEAERDEHAVRLARRAEQMWDDGILEETGRLIEAGILEGTTARRAIGTQQALAQLVGDLTREDAVAQTAAATVKYAKRQRTWFRRYEAAVRLRVDGSAASLGAALDGYLASANPSANG